MKNSVLIMMMFLCFSCGNVDSKDWEGCELKEPTYTPTLHEPSELAVLMNEMYTLSDSVKGMLQNDSGVVFDRTFEEIIGAQSVNDRVEEESFTVMANAYINAIKSFNETERGNKKMKFNSMVDACMNCHEQICFGPMSRIKKLYITP